MGNVPRESPLFWALCKIALNFFDQVVFFMTKCGSFSKAGIAALVSVFVISGCGGSGEGGIKTGDSAVSALAQPIHSNAKSPDHANDDKDGSSTTDDSTTSETTGTAALSWNPPMTREDGSSISMGELAGYEIVYGQDDASLNSSVTIDDPSVTDHTLDELGEGTWYFSVKAIDTQGLESDLSTIVTKSI